MLDKCRNCGFELDPCVNESHDGVCPRCGEPEGDAARPFLRAREEMAGGAKAALRAGLNLTVGNTTVN